MIIIIISVINIKSLYALKFLATRYYMVYSQLVTYIFFRFVCSQLTPMANVGGFLYFNLRLVVCITLIRLSATFSMQIGYVGRL